ncbi:MAG: GAF domain-containing protein, partial [Anaerolineae bacterium]
MRGKLGWAVGLLMLGLLAAACSGLTGMPTSQSSATPADSPRPQPRAQAPTVLGVEFRQLTIEDGLSQSTINCIVQDRRGFMWFGTQDGLNRYDGYDFRIYEHDGDDPHGLSANWVEHCYRDRQDRLWFVTDDGVLHRYDPALDRFDRYPLEVEDPHRQGAGNVRTLLGDSAGRLWIGTYGSGLVKYDPDLDRLVYYRDELDDPAHDSPHDNKVYTAYVDRSGTLWFGTGEGLVRYDAQDESFVRYPYRAQDDEPLAPDALRSPFVTNIYEDNGGRFWIGTTYGGLHELDRDTGHITAYPFSADDPNTLSGNTVRTLLEDREGKLWVASVEVRDNGTFERLGLERLDPENGEIVRFSADPDDPCSLSHEAVLLMHEDRQGALWFHTFAGGIDRYDPQTGCFTHHQRDPNNAQALSDDSLNVIYEDESGGLWLGTGAGGISFSHPTWTRFPAFAVDDAPPERESNNLVLRFHVPPAGIDADGHAQRLWVSTGAGINLWDRRTGAFTFYQIDPTLPDIITYALYEEAEGALWLGGSMGLYRATLAAGGEMEFTLVLPRVSPQVGIVSAILPDPASDDLWLGLYRLGLARFDPASGEVVRTYEADPADPGSLSDETIGGIFQGRDGGLWIATGSGLDRFDPATETFVYYRHDPDDPASLSDAEVHWVYEDASGVVWSGTNGDGLQRLDPDTGAWAHYREEDGLPNDVVYAVLPERQAGVDARLWLSTNHGLSRFDPHAETFRNYTHRDGLQSNEFNWQAAYLAPDGEMFFGGVDGINAFYPDQIWDDPYAPPVYVTGLFLANQPAEVGADAVLQRSVEVAESARLSYRDQVVSFEFAALYYAMPEMVQYAYKLEGFDEDWITAGKRRFVTYTSLPPRDYVFRVKAANADGVWNEAGASLPLTVVPPLWATWWFRGVAAVLVAGAVAAGYRLRVRNVEARARALEQQVAARTKELATLNAVAQTASQSLHLDDMLAATLDTVLERLGFKSGTIHLKDAETDELEMIYHRGLSAAFRQAVARGIIAAQAAESGRPIIIEDLAAEPDAPSKVVQEGYRSIASIPLTSRQEVQGVLTVASRQVHHFRQEHVDLLHSIGHQIGVAVENARLFEGTQRRLAQITALQETSTAVASTLELDELLTLIIRQATDLVGAEGGILNLVDWERNEDEAVACVGCTMPVAGRRASLTQSLSGWVSLHNQPVISNEIHSDERVHHSGLVDLEQEAERPIQNAAGVPLSIKGQVVGSLMVVDKDEGRGEFVQSDIDLLVAFANQAATAIENARLFQAEQRRAEQFRVITEVGHRITSILNIDQVLVQIVRLIQCSFDYDHVGIALIDAAEATYQVGAGELWDDPDFDFKPKQLRVGKEGLTGWVAGTGEPILVPDVRQEPRYVWMEGSQTRSEILVPIKVKGEVIGVLDVQSNRLNAFDQSDLALLQSLANQAAVAIKNAQLFEGEQRRAEQFRVISEVGSRVASILTVEELLDQMARLIQKAFSYYLVEIGLVENGELVFRTRASRYDERPFRIFRLPV